MSPLVAALSFFALLPCAFGTQGGGLVFPMELGEVRCFYQEAVEENSKVFVHVTSLDGGNDMHVLISGPVQLDTDMEPSLGSGDIVFEGDLNKDQEFGETKILFRAQTAGFYQVCIGNKRQLAKLAGVNIMAEDPTEQKVGPFRPMAPIKKTIIKRWTGVWTLPSLHTVLILAWTSNLIQNRRKLSFRPTSRSRTGKRKPCSRQQDQAPRTLSA
ncbi:hypothetical protein DIPPA_08119 [Diplonema papillatum]|nr:hypothetical protein DIPPA_08119 [Diplonema papillatum]